MHFCALFTDDSSCSLGPTNLYIDSFPGTILLRDRNVLGGKEQKRLDAANVLASQAWPDAHWRLFATACILCARFAFVARNVSHAMIEAVLFTQRTL